MDMTKKDVKGLSELIERSFDGVLLDKYNVSNELLEQAGLIEDYQLTRTMVLLSTINQDLTMSQILTVINNEAEKFYNENLRDYTQCVSIGIVIEKSRLSLVELQSLSVKDIDTIIFK